MVRIRDRRCQSTSQCTASEDGLDSQDDDDEFATRIMRRLINNGNILKPANSRNIVYVWKSKQQERWAKAITRYWLVRLRLNVMSCPPIKILQIKLTNAGALSCCLFWGPQQRVSDYVDHITVQKVKSSCWIRVWAFFNMSGYTCLFGKADKIESKSIWEARNACIHDPKSAHWLQLVWSSEMVTLKINLPRDREDYDGFEYTDGRLSMRRIQWCGVKFYNFFFWRVILKK